MLLSSLCSDEDNDSEGTILGEIRRQLAPNSSGRDVVKLGALAGLPLYATSAFDSVLERTAGSSSKILIVYGPHIGIGSDGIVGKKGTGACGTALGAYRVVAEERAAERIAEEKRRRGEEDVTSSGTKGADGDDEEKPFDVLSLVTTPGPQKDTLREVQEDYIIDELRKRLSENDMDNPDQNAVVLKVIETMYVMINELLSKELDSALKRDGIWERGVGVEIVMLGGIIIRGSGAGSEDLFEPLAFTSTKAGPSWDPYKVKKENIFPQLFDTKYSDPESQAEGQRAEEAETERKAEQERLEQKSITSAAEKAEHNVEQERIEQERIAAAKQAESRQAAVFKAKQDPIEKKEAAREVAEISKEATPVKTEKVSIATIDSYAL